MWPSWRAERESFSVFLHLTSRTREMADARGTASRSSHGSGGWSMTELTTNCGEASDLGDASHPASTPGLNTPQHHSEPIRPQGRATALCSWLLMAAYHGVTTF